MKVDATTLRPTSTAYLSWEHIQGTSPPVLHKRLQDWYVVAQALAASSRGGHDHIVAVHDSVNGLSLMSEELGDAACCQRCLHLWGKRVSGHCTFWTPSRNVLHVDNLQHKRHLSQAFGWLPTHSSTMRSQ